MKARTSFLKRCLAFALAVMLFASGTNMGIVLQAFAAGGDKVTVQNSKIVADNYDLTAEEKALLSSGYLAGGSYSYTIPGEGLVAVDTEGKKITAAAHEDWLPVEAYIMVGDESVETVALTDGKGTYNYDGNAFSVKVAYSLDVQVDADVQETLLKTGAWLKAGVANADVVAAQNGNLVILETALPSLVDLADNGIPVTIAGNSVTIEIDDPAVKEAIYELNDQAKANGGTAVNLNAMIAAYDASAKTQYVLTKGADMLNEVKNTSALALTIGDFVDAVVKAYGKMLDSATKESLSILSKALINMNGALDAVAAEDWTAAAEGTALVSASVNYAELDALVEALGAATAPAVKNPLHVADAEVRVNLNMYDVTVVVSLVVVENKNDSDELVEHAASAPVVVTLSENATRDEILAAVAAAGIEEAALAAWSDVYVAEHFEKNESALPETLTEDIEYEINYLPKKYTVKLSYGDDMTVHYGYKYTLPRHENAEQAYDYYVNGNKMAQGSVYTVVGDTEITREAGKAYTVRDLYALIAENYGVGSAVGILTSGALKGNETISVRKPDPADSTKLIKLEGGKLVIIDNEYEADYNNLNWVPYTYGANGNENKFGFEPTEVDWDGDSVKVKYRLNLTNFTAAQVKAIQDDIVALKAEADAQIATLERLNAKYDQMSQLDKTKLGALKGVISVTDLHNDATTNAKLQALFTEMVDGILANNLEGNNLRIYAILTDYQAGGLAYYYKNNAMVLGEIDSLSSYLDGLLVGDDKFSAEVKLAALGKLVGAAGYPEYVDKIAELQTIMSEVKNDLTAPNALIDVNSAALNKLTTALVSEDAAEFVTAASPYMDSENLTAIDNSKVMVQVFVEINGKSETFTTAPQKRGYVVTKPEVDALIASAEEYVKSQIGAEKFACYSVAGMSDLTALIGKELQKNANIYLTYSATEVTFTIEGVEEKQVITIENPYIELPAHTKTGWIYTYFIYDQKFEVENTPYTYEVSAENLAKGDYTITRTETNKALEDTNDALEGNEVVKPVTDENGNVVAVNVEMVPGAAIMETFANELMELGNYIELNNSGNALLDTGVVSVQALVDAILADNNFGSHTLISLGKNGGGVVFTATMDAGTDKDNLVYDDIDFTFTMKSVPSQMTTVAKGLEKVKNYMTFNSQDGVMSVNFTLPEKVYEAYLTAMLGAGVVDKTNINALHDEIAYQYLYDYVDLIINTDANTTTYTNTLKKLGQSYDLTEAEPYYQMVKKVLKNETTKVTFGANTTPNDEIFDVKVGVQGQPAVDKLIGLLGIDLGSYGSFLGMIKEYQPGESLNVAAVATLGNAPSSYEALVLDLNADGTLNKFDYTNDLPARVKTIKNHSAVILLGDVDGNLSFPGKTILDLNGFTVNGNVSGDLYIVDSSIATAEEGGVTGSVKATAIFGGTYGDTAGAAAALKDGYKLVGGNVQNVLFTVVKSNAKAAGDSYTYVVNTSFLEEDMSYTTFAKALAVDVAVDLVLNYFTAASLSVENNKIYAINFDNLITLLNSNSKVDDLITKTLGWIDAAGISATANIILDDLMDFAAIETALRNGAPVASYAMATSPWKVDVQHVGTKPNDYIDFGICASDDASLKKEFSIGIAFEGKYVETVADLAGELADIAEVDINVNLEQPAYADKTLTVKGSTDASAVIDVTLSDRAQDYRTVLGVILAYGNDAKRDAVKNALNNKDMDALKVVVDNTTVAEVFTALKAMSRNVDFAAMASAVGVTVGVDSAAKLEKYAHLSLCASGKVLEELDITGMNSKLGGLYNEESGYYELTKDKVFGPKDITKRGYTANVELDITKLSLKVKLFDTVNCLWGDADHDGDVDPDDATLILEYFVGLEVADFCTLRTDVDGDGDIDPDDATYVLEYYVGLITKFPAELK